MGNYSKLMHYTCYELGHCWQHRCSTACFEICVVAFIESCKIYGVVYFLTALVNARKLNVKLAKKILRNYITSVCFLTINGFGYISYFCIIRHLLGHINYLTASYLPGFLASVTAIMVERPERRALLAIYCLNVASESLWNSLIGCGYVKPIPRGEIIVFSVAMAVIGYFFRSPKPTGQLIHSILVLFLGRGECGAMMSERAAASSNNLLQHTHSESWIKRLLSPFTSKHHLCPHRGGCIPNFLVSAGRGFIEGYLIQLGVRVLPSIFSLFRRPSKIVPLILHPVNTKAGIFLAWFTSVFKGTCCVGRWWTGQEKASHGAVAGALAGLSMYWYPAHSMALYIMWKVLESLYEKGYEQGHLPRIPYSIELLYSVAVGYLFHIAVMEKHYMKTSYWRFLDRLTWSRLGEYNRHLLPYGLKSEVDFKNYWPPYNLDFVGEEVKRLTLQRQAQILISER